jgi:hypothetical protein
VRQIGVKYCPECGQYKRLSEFGPSARHGVQSYCRECRPHAHRRRKYGLARREYMSLLLKQGSRCAVCRKRRRLVVDHNHETGEVRGLLCDHCNHIVGILESMPSTLASAQRYLREVQA